jgi:hypothetical protein
MIIGQSAGVAVAQALRNGKQVRSRARARAEVVRSTRSALQAVQDVDVAELQHRLRQLGQLIDLTDV